MKFRDLDFKRKNRFLVKFPEEFNIPQIGVEKILTINFDDLDYSDDSILKPFLIFKPFDCKLN